MALKDKGRLIMTNAHHHWHNHDHYHHPSHTETLLLHTLPLHRHSTQRLCDRENRQLEGGDNVI